MYKKLIFTIACCLVINSSYAMSVKEFDDQKDSKRTLVGIYLRGLYTGFTVTEFMKSTDYSHLEFCPNKDVIYSEENFVKYLEMMISDMKSSSSRSDANLVCDKCPIEPIFYSKMRQVSKCKPSSFD